MASTATRGWRARIMTGLALIGSCLLSSEAAATTFSVSPTRVELKPGATSSVITVTNTGTVMTRFQVSAFSWDQGADGSMRLEDTRDIVFYPPLVEIGPGESRRIRVGTTATMSALERTFRLFVEELPDNVEQDPDLGVHVRARMGIPVFVGGAPGQPSVTIEDARAADGRVSLRLRNAGSVHVAPSSVTVTGLTDTNAVVFEQQVPVWYLLAQHTLAVAAEVDGAKCAGVALVQLVARFEGGRVVTTRVPVTGRLCSEPR
ncbi:MAG: fimbria/pilus periplasmic chaperone [Vicinamibacterales bacterium]